MLCSSWDAAKMSDAEISNYTHRLGELGFVWMFITLAGFHADALAIDTLAKYVSDFVKYVFESNSCSGIILSAECWRT